MMSKLLNPMRAILAMAGVVAVLFGGDTVQACAVPVFRYALEQWPAAPGFLAVFHNKALSPEQLAMVESLGQSNLVYVQTCNVAAPTNAPNQPPELVAAWETLGRPTPPVVALFHQTDTAAPAPVWQRPLDATAVQLLVASPAPREIARRLLAGDSTVWVLLTSGDAAKDAAARKVLATSLRQAEQELKLPAELDPTDPSYDTSINTNIVLKIAFSVLEVPMSSPDGALIRGMTASLATNLATSAGPAAVPVFGRARALTVLLDDTLTEENVLGVCGFLTAPCSCTVKAMNPGADLYVPVNWEALITRMIGGNEELPPLEVPGAQTMATQATVKVATPVPVPQATAGSPLRRSLWIVLAVAVAATAAGTLIALRKKQ